VQGEVDNLTEMRMYKVLRSAKYNAVMFHSDPSARLAIVRSPSPIPVVTHAYENLCVKSDVSLFCRRSHTSPSCLDSCGVS
jgi:hypothetical protein